MRFPSIEKLFDADTLVSKHGRASFTACPLSPGWRWESAGGGAELHAVSIRVLGEQESLAVVTDPLSNNLTTVLSKDFLGAFEVFNLEGMMYVFRLGRRIRRLYEVKHDAAVQL